MIRKKSQIEFYDEQIAERVAKIFGNNSAARLALNELKRRRSNGEDCNLFRDGSAVIVASFKPEIPKRA